MSDSGEQNDDSARIPNTETQDSAQPAGREPKRLQNQGPLLALIGAGKPDFESIEEVDVFIRAERATWSS